jgi:hypothetical protein
MKKIIAGLFLVFFVVGMQFAQTATVYEIGAVGPGGGIVFAAEDKTYYEISPILGQYTWDEAVSAVKAYRAGSFTDWRLPTNDELALLYENLVLNKNLKLENVFLWTSTKARNRDGDDFYFFRRNLSNNTAKGENGASTAGLRGIRVFTTQ